MEKIAPVSRMARRNGFCGASGPIRVVRKSERIKMIDGSTIVALALIFGMVAVASMFFRSTFRARVNKDGFQLETSSKEADVTEDELAANEPRKVAQASSGCKDGSACRLS